MTLPIRRREFRASPNHYEKNLSASAATRVVPAVLTHADGHHHDNGIALFQGTYFAGVLTQDDARRIADDIHDLLDTIEHSE